MWKLICLSLSLILYLFSSSGDEMPLRVTRTPDWSNFETTKDVDPLEAREMLSKISVKFYWDVLRGLYRTGVVAEGDLSVLTEEMDHQLKLIKKVNKQVNHRRQAFTVEHKIIETSILFMFMLSSIKDLSISSYDMENELFAYLQTHPVNTFISSETYLNQFNFTSQADLDAELEILQLQQLVMNYSHSIATQRQQVDLQNIHDLHYGRKLHREELHEHLLLALQTHYQHIDELLHEKHDNLTQLFTTTQNRDFEVQQALLLSEYNDLVDNLQREINMTFELIQYRHTEESRVFSETNQMDLQVTQTKLDLSREQMETIVSTIFEELLSLFSSSFGDIWAVLLYTRVFLLLMITVITVIEVLKSLHLIIKKLSSSSSNKSRVFVPQQPSTKTSFFWSSKSHQSTLHETATTMVQSIESEVILNTQERQLLEQIFSTFCLSMTTPTSTFLPTILLQGAAGCGKTFTSKLILEEVNKLTSNYNNQSFSLLMFNGHDLLALGTQANIFLRDLFELKRKMIVVIDDVDTLIQSRDLISAQSMLYALLEGLRQPSKTLCIIFTTRLSIDKIDAALLDRVDSILHFTLPTIRQRLLFLKTHLSTAIGSFLTSNSSSSSNQDDQLILEREDEVESMLEEIAGDVSVFAICQACGLLLPSNYQHATTTNTTSSRRRESSSSRSSRRRREPEQPEDERPSNNSPAVNNQPWTGQQVADFITKCRFDDQLLASEGLHVRVKACIQLLLLRSEGWSYRDLNKHVMNLRYAIQSSERCQLTTAMWVREIAAEVANSNSMMTDGSNKNY